MTPAKAKKKTTKASSMWTAEEKAAMRETARERKTAGKVDGEKEVLAKLSAMAQPDRSMGMRLHELVKTHAPALTPRTWYGMPAYARDGKVVCFFQSGAKFKTRYSTLGFQDPAMLDDGDMWPVSFALKRLGPSDEARIISLLKKAVGA